VAHSEQGGKLTDKPRQGKGWQIVIGEPKQHGVGSRYVSTLHEVIWLNEGVNTVANPLSDAAPNGAISVAVNVFNDAIRPISAGQ
jgi:hypothetical protein